MKKIIRTTKKQLRVILSLVAVIALATAIVASQKPQQAKAAVASDASATTPCVGSPAPASWKHVVVIMFENHTYNQVIGSSDAPYITGLAGKCATNKNWKDANYKVNGSSDGSYNSKPSYATLTSGVSPSSHGLKDDTYSTKTSKDNIFNQLRVNGKSSKSYFSWSGTGCGATGSGDYHDAIRYYTNIDSTYCNAHDVNLSQFMTDVNGGGLPEFSIIYPTNCENMHSCSSVSNVVQNGDNWIKNFLPNLLNSARYKSGDTAIFYLWDEDSPIPNVLMAPSVVPGCTIPSANCNISGNTANPVSHFAALRTWEEMLGLPLIGDTAQAPSLLPVFGGSGCGTTCPPPNDTTPPTVSVSSPANGSTTSATSVPVTANASDNVAVAKVEFQVNGVTKSTDTSSPYSFNWDTTGVSSGAYTIKAIATDTSNNTSQNSITINFIASSGCTTSLPTTSIGSATMTVNIPSAGAYHVWSRIMAPDTTNNSYILQIDNDCPIVVGDSPLQAANSWVWVDYKDADGAKKINPTLTSGSHTIKMIGREANVGLDRVLFLSDTCTPTGTGDNCLTTPTPPPTASLTFPPPNQTLHGTETLTATATAGTGTTIANVEFFQGLTSLGKDTSSPYSVAWDTTTVPNGTYTVSAVATDALGQKSSASSAVVTVLNSDTTPPSQPGNFRATSVTYNKVSLAWDASTDNKGVAGYHIYLNGNTTPYATVTGTTYDDTNVQPTTGYIYQVEAFDAAGNKSPKAGVGVTTPAGPDTQKPSTPGNLAAGTPTDTQVPLTWTASTDNVAVKEYLIRRDGVVIDTTTDTSYTDTTVSPGTTYKYVVIARDTSNNSSDPSNEVSVTTLNPNPTDTEKPSVPGNVIARAPTSSQANVSWDASTDNVGVTGYKVYRNGTFLANTTALTFGDGTVSAGQKYTYTVSAYDAAKNESAQSTAAVVTVPGNTNSIFSDNFENGSAYWAPVQGDWSVANGAYHQDAAGDAWSTAGSPNWSDYSVEASVKPQSFITGTAASQFAAIYGRWQDNTHWYYVVLRSNGNLELKKNVGNVYTLLASKQISVTPGTSYRLKLTMQGSSLKVALNGQDALSATDSSITAGKIGLGTYYAKADFDDVNVTQNSAPVLTAHKASADATIKKQYPNRNYGGGGYLVMGGNITSSTLMRFNVSNLSNRFVTNATLLAYVNDPMPSGGKLYSVGNNWVEGTAKGTAGVGGVTWNTAPSSVGSTVIPLTALEDNKWKTIDVTSIVRGEGTYSFRIDSPNAEVGRFNSRETVNIPQLWISSQNLSL